MLRRFFSVSGFTLLSRIAGFIRDIMTAALLGAGPIADAFVVAFRFPNHFRALFAEGAFNAAFVPIFSGLLVKQGEQQAREFADRVFGYLFWCQLALLLLLEAIMPQFMVVFAPGFRDDPEKFNLAVELTRITFPYLLFISLVSLQSGVLNSLNRFAAPAATPVIMNVTMVLFLVFGVDHFSTAGHALAWGVLAAGLTQYLYLVAVCQKLRLPVFGLRLGLTPEIRQFFKVLGPAALGAGVVQVSLFFDTLIASFLADGAVSYLYYADRINQLPIGLIGVALGTVLLPELSRHLKNNDPISANHIQNRAIELSLLLTLPAMIACLLIGPEIMAGLFQRGAFTAGDAAGAADTLAAYAVGLPAFVLIKSFVMVFYAKGDTKTPLKIAMIVVAINIALKLALIGPLAQIGLALSTALSAWVNFFLLVYLLRRESLYQMDQKLKSNLLRFVLMSVAVASALLAILQFQPSELKIDSDVSRVVRLLLLVMAGGATWAVTSYALGLFKRG